MNNPQQKTVWFVTGSQSLYGPEVLSQVDSNSREISASLDNSPLISQQVIFRGTVKSPEEILNVCLQANSDPDCIGLILWMHTFSPAKMWISGLKALNKPWMHLHTQFNAALPWQDINMHFMNLNQSAHGDREFGFIGTRMRLDRKVVAGHWQQENVQSQIDDWIRSARGWHESQNLKVARFGDNMRQVAVTEGNKVSAQIQFGYEVHAYGQGDLAEVCDDVSDADIDRQLDLYGTDYVIDPALLKDDHARDMIRREARLELGMSRFLEAGQFGAFTNCFENLTGITNLPGLATQRLMSQGYGYGGEGDWKTSAMVRIMKVMAEGKTGGTSFMEDYTYNFGARDQALGAHMLEVCPSIAAARPKLDVQLHTIGCHEDVARLIFSATEGPSINVSPIDLGNRFRLLVNVVDTITPPQDLPNLPVAHALWEPRPDLSVASSAWIHAGGAHHTVYSQSLTLENMVDYADMAGIELVVIDENTDLCSFRNELRQNAAYYHLSQGL